ncbi:MAG: HEAT repeat domain-containing protein [Roseimicrobium sp.]
MEPVLLILTVIALSLAATSVVLWLCLLLYRMADNRRRKRREQVADRWLCLLLPALEGGQDLASLPRLRGRLETEAVLGLLRDLAERFRGQYRDNLHAVLHHIGAEDYGFRLVKRSSANARMRGCALLAWMAPSVRVDEKLATLLRDPRPGVRLEAAHALAARRTPSISLETIITSLRGTGALRSDRARDIIRLMSPGHGGALSWLLETAIDPREKALLLDGLAVAGDFAHASQAALFLSDGSSKVRATAVSTLEQLADPMHIEAVAVLARDPDPRVRLCVARYAKTMHGDVSAIAVLETLSMDRNFEVRRVAVHALAAWRGRSWDQLAFLARQDPLLESLMREAAQSTPQAAPETVVHAP